MAHAPADFPQPWFDGRGGLFPSFHVLKSLGRARGATLRQLDISAPREIQALCAETGDGGAILWLANLTGETREAALDPALPSGRIATLDAESFIAAATSPNALDDGAQPGGSRRIALGPFAIARLTTI
jgi:hypothetical protein